VAERLRPGDHLCGHSYGAVVSLFAAEVARDLRSLTVIEPPAFGLATDDPQVAAYAERQKEYWAAGSCGLAAISSRRGRGRESAVVGKPT
jgi:pimeloyl-ACP methyl ester carboxylesterase